MGYNIVRTELNDSALDCINKVNGLSESFAKIENDFQSLIDNTYFAGEWADTIKTYLRFEQLTAVKAIQLALAEYSQVFALFAESFSNFDESYEAVFNEDYFDELVKNLKSLKQSLYDNQIEAYNAETAVDDIIKEDYIKTYSEYEDPLSKVITDVSFLGRCIKRHDKNFIILALQDLKELIADAKNLVGKIKEKGVISYSEMGNVCYLSLSEAKKLQTDYKEVCDNLWRNRDEFKKGFDYISKYSNYKIEKLSQTRVKTGIVKMGCAVITTVVAGILTGGVATPALIPVVECAFGATVVCDAGLFTEGYQDFCYGTIKDIQSPTINPTRDILFLGNQDVYELVSMTAYSICFGVHSIDKILVAGQAPSAIEGVVAENLIKGNQISVAAEQVVFNLAAPVGNEMVEKYAESCTDDPFDQFLIQQCGNILVQAATGGIAKVAGGGTRALVSKYYLETSKITVTQSGDVEFKTYGNRNPESGFFEELSPERGAKYNKWSIAGENGTHNNYLCLDEIDIKAWKYSDGKVAEANALARNSGDEVLGLKNSKSETFSAEYNYKSMYEQQYLHEFSYKEHIAVGNTNSESFNSGVKNSYGKTSGGSGYQGGSYTDTITWGIQEINVRPEGKGFWGKRVKQNNPRVDNFELKINPNNESYYLPHPKGGYVQFENMLNSTVQDGKLIMKQKSFYHVNDMPDFAKTKVLSEAQRQIDAASMAGYKVQWLVSDENAVSQLRGLFEGMDIEIIYYPE